MEIVKNNMNIVGRFDFSDDVVKTIRLKRYGFDENQAKAMYIDLNMATDNFTTYDEDTLIFVVNFAKNFKKYRGVPYAITPPYYEDYVYGDTWEISIDENDEISTYLVIGNTKVEVVPESLYVLDKLTYRHYDIEEKVFPTPTQCECCY